MFYRFTAVCTDSDSDGTYKHIVRRYGAHNAGWNPPYISAGVRSFTRKANAIARSIPATNPGWENE